MKNIFKVIIGVIVTMAIIGFCVLVVKPLISDYVLEMVLSWLPIDTQMMDGKLEGVLRESMAESLSIEQMTWLISALITLAVAFVITLPIAIITDKKEG